MTPWRHCAERTLCPVCGDVLAVVDRSLRCPARHSFDIARQGYVDLLPHGHGRSSLAGDAGEMVRARQRFLGRGHYAAISDAINRIVRDGVAGSSAQPPEDRVILESGCGDGHYVGRLARSLGIPDGGEGERGACAFGLDLSKEALRLAARAHPRVAFFINDVNHRICLPDGSVDALLDVFAPRNPVEFARVLRPGGVLLVVVPLDAHLSELRATTPLLGIQPDKRERVEEQLAGPFRLDAVERVQRRLTLTAEDVLDLLRMTPAYWHTDERERREAAGQAGRETTLAVEVLRFRRAGVAGR